MDRRERPKDPAKFAILHSPVNYDANRLGPYPNPYRLAIGLGKHIKVPEVPERDQSIEH